MRVRGENQSPTRILTESFVSGRRGMYCLEAWKTLGMSKATFYRKLKK